MFGAPLSAVRGGGAGSPSEGVAALCVGAGPFGAVVTGVGAGSAREGVALLGAEESANAGAIGAIQANAATPSATSET